MRLIRYFALAGVMCFFVAAAGAQTQITKNSAGRVKIGMTVATVRRVVRPMKLGKTTIADGVPAVEVKSGRRSMMTLICDHGGDSQATNTDETAKVSQILVDDKSYRTAAGVHPDMLLRDAERKYGKVKTIMKSEIEQQEFVTFTRNPKGIEFQLNNKNGEAGRYAAGKNETKRYRPGTTISEIIVTGTNSSGKSH